MKTKLLLLFAVFSFFNIQAQQCTTSFSQGTGSLSPNYSCGQGFIAQCDGTLEYVQFLASAAGTVAAGTLKIYYGNQVSGNPIYTQSHPAITVSQANDPIRVDITGVVNMVNNAQYTFEITINNVDILFDFAGGYSGGTFFQSDNGIIIEQPNFDLNFEVSIAAPCTVTIPDANFKAALVADTAINTNGNTEIECSEASAFTGGINVGNLSISDLTGIEAFTNLTLLLCYNNSLTSLDVSSNTTLTDLYCYNNNLTSLDVTQNTALINLECYTNQLSSLNVSQNMALTRLSISSNMFTSLDVSANTDLEYLDCEGNQLSSLDVSTNTALTQLYCSYNQLTSLDVLANTALGVLQCSNNQLSNINVSANTALQGLGCSYNQLISLDVSANTALQGLDCSNNQLSSLDVANGNNLNLVQLNALNNQDLTCIQIDAGFTPPTAWQKEPTASYSDDCAALLGIDDFHLNSISLHPNPTTSILNIEMTQNIKQATVYSMLGKEVLKTQNKKLDVSSLENGVFLIKIEEENGNVSTIRFIKQ